MPYYFERLSGQDSSMLYFEGPSTHMHVAGTSVFELGPFAAPDGGVDIDRLRRYIASRLHYIPRYRQRLAFTPIEGLPVWVDDDRFNINYHVRHASLPKPGDDEQLKRLSSRITSQQLDRGKPLWECWIIEGLTGDRFAMVSKTHHCMIDGISGVDLMTVLMSPEPDTAIEEAPQWIPRPAPRWIDLAKEEIVGRANTPMLLLHGLREALSDPEQAREQLVETLSAVWSTLGTGLTSAPPTPLNKPIGPHRRFDWMQLDLGEVKQVKSRLGGTVNDVVLTTVAGAVRQFLERRRVNVELIDFRALVPVSVRSAAERGKFGNRVSAWFAALPIQERDPIKRFNGIQAMTSNLKESKSALGAEVLTQMAEWMGPTILHLGVRLSNRVRPYNMVVTNVPGPQFPFYMNGAKLLAVYPQVPLFERVGLGVALFSYMGKIFWGFNADWDLVPDLNHFVKAVETSFRELYSAAMGVQPAATVPPAPPPRAEKKRPLRTKARSRANGAAARLE